MTHFALAVRFLHILSAALWMGAVLFWPGALRRALKSGPPLPEAALAQARVGLGLDLGAGLATLVTGLVYASPAGVGETRFGIILGLTFALARLVLLVALARPSLRATSDAIAAGDLDAARVASRRLPAYTGMAHLLWLFALVTMVFPI